MIPYFWQDGQQSEINVHRTLGRLTPLDPQSPIVSQPKRIPSLYALLAQCFSRYSFRERTHLRQYPGACVDLPTKDRVIQEYSFKREMDEAVEDLYIVSS